MSSSHSWSGGALVDGWAFPHPKFLPALDAVGATVTGVGRHGKYLLGPPRRRRASWSSTWA